MASIGASDILSLYNGDNVQVAELLLLGLIDGYDLTYALESVNEQILSIARTRLEWKYGQNPVETHRQGFQTYIIYNRSDNIKDFKAKIARNKDFKILKWISDHKVIVVSKSRKWSTHPLLDRHQQQNAVIAPFVDA